MTWLMTVKTSLWKRCITIFDLGFLHVSTCFYPNPTEFLPPSHPSGQLMRGSLRTTLWKGSTMTTSYHLCTASCTNGQICSTRNTEKEKKTKKQTEIKKRKKKYYTKECTLRLSHPVGIQHTQGSTFAPHALFRDRTKVPHGLPLVDALVHLMPTILSFCKRWFKTLRPHKTTKGARGLLMYGWGGARAFCLTEVCISRP